MDAERSKRPSGTERRRRTELVAVRLLPDEHRRLARVAESRGVTVATLLRTQINELIGAVQQEATESEQ
jgi:hypothetical protein